MMKKKSVVIIIAIVAIVVIFIGLGVADYKKEDLLKPFTCSSIDNNGKPSMAVSIFDSSSDSIYCVCKSNKFYVKEAEIRWYNIESNIIIKTEKVVVNKNGYFISELPANERLKKGKYRAYIYEKSKVKSTSERIDFEIQ